MKIQLVISGRHHPTSDAVPQCLDLSDGATVDDALKSLAEQLSGVTGSDSVTGSDNDAPLSNSCLIALSGTHLGTLADHQSPPLRDGDELVVIAPVAGG